MAKTRAKKTSKKKPTGRRLPLFKLLIALAFLAGLGHLVWRYQQNPVQTAPYPYRFQGEPEAQALHSASQGQVLIVGDRMAKGLEAYLDALIKNASANTTEPIAVKFLAQEGAGLHRTLAQLKKMTTFPPVIIYYGASQELFEQRVHPVQYDTFMHNKKLHEHEMASSALMAWPELSRLLYEPYQYFVFDLATAPQEAESIGSGPDKLKQLEMLYQVYAWELDELVKLTKAKNSRLILMTTPVNLDPPPVANCALSEDDQVRQLVKDYVQLLQEGKSKEVYEDIKKLAEKTVINARVLWLAGKVALELGKYSEAKRYLTQARAVDCGSTRTNPVFNGIIRQVSQRHGITLIDYDNELNAMYGQNVLFFDEVNPQNVYNRAMMEKVGELIARIMDL